MIRNYIKVAIKYLTKHKGYTLINTLGLSVGIACCILIMLFVKSEWSFDRMHSKENRIYRAWLEEHYKGEVFRNTVTPVPLGPVLQGGLPEAEATCRVATLRPLVRIGNNGFNDPVTMVDSTFFNLFDFKLKTGDTRSVFREKTSIVLTESLARKYFGNEAAIDKTIDIALGNDTLPFRVSAIVSDPPLESSLQFGMLIPFSNAVNVWNENTRLKAWSNVVLETYVMLKSGTELTGTHQKIQSIMNPLVAQNYKPGEYIIRLQPLRDLHFNASLPEDMPRPSDPKYSYILATIGLLILLIACINFVTLSIGRSVTRALEVGVRKVLGADRRQLIGQFWGEALLLTFLAMIAGILLAWLFHGSFNQLANRELALEADGFTLLFCLVLAIIIGLVAGIYPAIILSGFKPIEVLKGKMRSGNIGFFRKGLIVGQFVASIIMIIGTFTVGKQLQYMRDKDLGFNREHTIVVSTNKSRAEGNKLAGLFKSALKQQPAVISTTASLFSMAEYGWMNLGYTDDKNVFRQFRMNQVDADFVPSMGLQLVAGRSFSKDQPSDSNYILVNEALVKEYGWKDAIGQKLPGEYQQRVLGVVKDFHFESLHNPIRPVVLTMKPDSIFSQSSDISFNASPRPRISVRFREGNLQEHVELLRTTWKSVAGDQDF
ncbi:MAG: ABC transporter permease, partial [Flavisolibacter sp.]